MNFNKTKLGKYLLMLIICFVFCSGNTILAVAASGPIVLVNSGSGNLQDSVSINIEVSQANNIAGGSFDLYYDKNKVKPINASKTELLSSALFLPNLNYNDNGRNAVRIVWAGANGISEDGVICTVDFKLVGMGTTQLSLENLVLKDAETKTLMATKVNGQIVIEGSDTTTPTDQSSEKTIKPPVISNHSDKVTVPRPVSAVTGENNSPVLKDIQKHWAKGYIDRLVDLKIINGYKNGTFLPEKSITRAEFAKVIVLAAGLSIEESPSLAFADHDNIAVWARPYITAALKAGIIKGYEDHTFRAQENISRSEIAVMVVRAMNRQLPENYRLDFKDAQDVPEWARPYVRVAVDQGIINGTPENNFLPGEKANRAQAAAMTIRMLDRAGN